MKWLGIILLIILVIVLLIPVIVEGFLGVVDVFNDVCNEIKSIFFKKQPDNLEPEFEEGDFYLLKDLSDRIKKGETQFTSLELQLQANYPKRLEWLLNR